MSHNLDFTPVKRSGMRQREFAYFAGVSRVAVNGWARNRAEIGELRLPKIRKLLVAVDNATKAGDLPIPRGDKTSSECMDQLKAVLVKHLKAISK